MGALSFAAFVAAGALDDGHARAGGETAVELVWRSGTIPPAGGMGDACGGGNGGFGLSVGAEVVELRNDPSDGALAVGVAPGIPGTESDDAG